MLEAWYHTTCTQLPNLGLASLSKPISWGHYHPALGCLTCALQASVVGLLLPCHLQLMLANGAPLA